VSDINQIQERATLASQDEPPLADNARVLAWENAFAMAGSIARGDGADLATARNKSTCPANIFLT
jgi:hypothetical protein